MALTPDDVVTKEFQHVRFKEGFDPDEVDDFLDEIVVEWRKTLAENEELKSQIATLKDGKGASTPPAAPAPAHPEPVVAGVDTQTQVATASLLELAQRLHDEHIAEGVAKRDEIVAEGKRQAASIVADAEMRARDIKSKLDRERVSLESKVTELREFERDYRSQLRSFVESRLKDLDASAQNATPPADSKK